MEFTLQCLGLSWDLAPLASFQFIPFEMEMSVLCLGASQVIQW